MITHKRPTTTIPTHSTLPTTVPELIQLRILLHSHYDLPLPTPLHTVLQTHKTAHPIHKKNSPILQEYNHLLNTLTTRYLPFIRSYIYKHYSNHYLLDDILQEGAIALQTAIQHYDIFLFPANSKWLAASAAPCCPPVGQFWKETIYPPTQSHLISYIAYILRREIRNFLQKQTKGPPIHTVDPLSDTFQLLTEQNTLLDNALEENTIDTVDYTYQKNLINQAITLLTPKQQAIIHTYLSLDSHTTINTTNKVNTNRHHKAPARHNNPITATATIHEVSPQYVLRIVKLLTALAKELYTNNNHHE